MRAPDNIETARLVLRPPLPRDAEEIFERYARDPEVTKFVGFPAHSSVDDARTFVAASLIEWDRWNAGPYLIRSRSDQSLLGGTGLHCETPHRAMTGYVFARDAWGKGYATEALGAMVVTAAGMGIRRLYALCHTGHRPSAHVLEKSDFVCEGILRGYMVFPNLARDEPCDVYCYARILPRSKDMQE